jgi:hypothetical protein
MMGGGPAVSYACHVYEALEQFEGRQGGLSPDLALAGAGVVDDPD